MPAPGVSPAEKAPAYFRSYEQVTENLRSLARKYPDLARVEDIGDSFEKTTGKADRDIWALRLGTPPKEGEERPSVLYLGGVHAREIANPELLVRWAGEMLAGYGTDPVATALLSQRQIDIVPMVNPDGHAVVERGYATNDRSGVWWRKNTNGEGTDLNRNFDFRWQDAKSSGSSPRSDDYPGSAAASEPETRAVQDFALKTKPAMFVDFHSSGKYHFLPWGDRKELPEKHDDNLAVAGAFAGFNGHRAMTSYQYGAKAGTSKDWAHGVLGVPAMTIETGSRFHQSDAEFELVYRANAPVMTYGAQIAPNPAALARGPRVEQVTIGPEGAISALATDVAHGNKPLQAAEFVRTPDVEPGAGITLHAADGRFDSPKETLVGRLGGGGVVQGSPDHGRPTKLGYIRGQDADGNWGPLQPAWVG